MSSITTHVLDTAFGRPAGGIAVHLEKQENDAWTLAGNGVTDSDGRCRDLSSKAEVGIYRLTFLTKAYFSKQQRASLYAEIAITFLCDGEAHYHLPLLLSDHSYTTYRGS